MHKLGLIGFSLATLGCVALNPSYDDRQTDGSSASGGVISSTGVVSVSASGTGSSTTSDAPGSTEVDTTTSPQPVEFIDQQWEEEFAEAKSLGPLEWLDGSVQLQSASEVGTLESRIYDAGREALWSELRWTPRAPYEVPLQIPDGDEDVSYMGGNTGLQSLELLAHLDAGPYMDTEAVADATGQHNGVWVGETTESIAGKFGPGMAHDDNNDMDANRIELPIPIEPGFGPFTWTVWYRSLGCAGMNMLALDASPDAAGAGLYFMACGGNSTCENPGSRYAVAFLRGPNEPLAQVCSDVPIDDDVWHHLALRREVIDAGQAVEMFVDGRRAGGDVFPSVTGVSVHLEAAVQENFTLAGGNEPIHSGAGAYDEFALWNRALDIGEIENLYRRGVRVARFQVRACDDPECDGEDFVGPGGSIDSQYVDPGPQFDHTIDLSELGLRGRYVQYRFLLRRPASVPSPAIEMVTVAGVRL